MGFAELKEILEYAVTALVYLAVIALVVIVPWLINRDE